ncbi:MAG: hypothetical protein JNK15_17950 [Planctomycetes bacterium]|nr:hypothetical protein [Planctomycetota bacterium]
MNGSRTPFRRLFAAWLATFFAFVAVAHGNFETTDAGFTLLAARNLVERGDSGIRRADQGATSVGEAQAAQAIGLGIAGKVGPDGIAYTWFPFGHQLLLVPFAWVGDSVERAWPGIDTAFRTHAAPGQTPEQARTTLEHTRGSPVLVQGLVSVLLPPACAASILLLLFLLARRLGAGDRDAWTTALVILLTTQCFAFGRETLSDGPGLVLLLATVLAVANVRSGAGVRTALLGGLCGGAAVSLRYQNAALLVPIGLALLLACRRPRRPWPVVAFVLGVLPAAALLLLANHARFGDPFDTGYPKVDAWLDQPAWLGAVKILFAAGRGVAWLSPIVWLALPLAANRRVPVHWRWLAWLVFLFPLWFFARARGWQGGECWGARYVTHGLVLLLAIVLPQATPWRRWPKACWALAAFGAFACLTSVVAPVRGVKQLADQAAWARGLAADETDMADPVSWRVEFTPLVANWRYAVASAGGGFEVGGYAARDGRAIAAVFGAEAATERQKVAPVRWEDRSGRHLWWRFWGDVLELPWWALLLPPVAFAVLFAWFAARPRPPAASDSPTAR